MTSVAAPVAGDRRQATNDLQLQEAINAELALLASLQRRERFLRREGEQSEQASENQKYGEMLAALHSATLGPNPVRQSQSTHNS